MSNMYLDGLYFFNRSQYFSYDVGMLFVCDVPVKKPFRATGRRM
jgi:hypothetical protein